MRKSFESRLGASRESQANTIINIEKNEIFVFIIGTWWNLPEKSFKDAHINVSYNY